MGFTLGHLRINTNVTTGQIKYYLVLQLDLKQPIEHITHIAIAIEHLSPFMRSVWFVLFFFFSLFALVFWSPQLSSAQNAQTK